MKKIPTLFLSLFCCLLFGVILIPHTSAATITKTIGGSSPDFTTISDAVTWLNAEDDGGPISDSYVFTIRSGTYTERINFTPLDGASLVNTITFQSESGVNTDVVWASPAPTSDTNNYVIRLNGADYFIFQNMTLQNILSQDYGSLVLLENSAINNTFLGIKFLERSSFTGATVFFVHVESRGANHYLRIEDSTFVDGGYAMRVNNFSGYMLDAIIKNNTYTNQVDTVISYSGQDGMLIEGNTIIGYDYHDGIYMDGENVRMKIINNHIDKQGGSGITHMNSSTATALEATLIANNRIYIGSVSGSSGLMVLGKYNYVYHNSVFVDNAFVPAFKIADSDPLGTVVKNNIFYNAQGIAYSSLGGTFESDYNVIYSGSGNLAEWNFTPVSTLINWQNTTSQDAHSIETHPYFLSTSNLRPTTIEPNGAAFPITGISELLTDALGTTRSLTSPDIGAIEYALTPNEITTTVQMSSMSPGIMNVTQIFEIAPAVPIPDGGKIALFFPGQYGLGSVTPLDVEVSGIQIADATSIVSGQEITSILETTSPSTTIMDPITISVEKLTLPSDAGSYSIGIATYDENDLLLESGMVSAEVGTEFQIHVAVTEAIVLSIQNPSLSFQLDPSVNNGQDYSQYTLLSASTNALNGYRIYGSLSGGALTNGSATIPGGLGVNAFSYFATNLSRNPSQVVVPDAYFASSPTFLSASGDDVGYPSMTNEQDHTIYYGLAVDYTMPAGVYTGTISYTIVPTF